MQKHEPGSQNVRQDNENPSDKERDQTQIHREFQTNKITASPLQSNDNENKNSGIKKTQIKDSILMVQSKVQTYLENISIESPLKRPIVKSQAQIGQKVEFSKQKMNQKLQIQPKQRVSQDHIIQPKMDPQSHMKSSVKSSHRLKKLNKPFYEETFYITGMKENYLLLLSDTNQVLEFPIGMFTTQGEAVEGQRVPDETSSNKGENYHLIKDIKIGQPIRIKLEFDFLRQQKDDRQFLSLQRNINAQYSQTNYQQQQSHRFNKEINVRKSK